MTQLSPPIVFPDAVDTVLELFTAKLPAIPNHRRIPASRPAKWLRVIRTGGVRRYPVVDMAQITVEAWADRPADAADLVQLARAYLNASVGSMCSRVDELGGPADLPDVESQQNRYTFTSIVHLRGVAVA